MATKLVIVESPAKAKTIGGYLGSDYEVQASIGHIRDLPLNGKSLPEALRKKWWSDYAVDVDNGFEPFYEVPAAKQEQVRKLRASLKGKNTLVLATDEDREGESISWHLLQVLKPTKAVEVVRIAFHEITRDAIQRALAAPRQVDEKLVQAQETRRILDRLYGYTLSPVLWSRVTKNLSAGRVQTPAVKLIVEREEARRLFKAAVFWDLTATLAADKPFEATLRDVDGARIATGADFDDQTGLPKAGSKARLLSENEAKALVESLKVAKPWTVTDLQAKEREERPAPPFMTTTLQQDANRKFAFSADRTMRVAQTLYEGVNIQGEHIGLITYMRTDSLSLSGEAIGLLRGLIGRDYPDCLPDKPNHYAGKVRNAQEAHEAIRPTDPNRKPADIAKYLTPDQQKIYELIWKRSVASQMKPAQVLRTEVRVEAKANGVVAGFGATGKQYLFDGFHRVYMEGRDDAGDDQDRMLPRLRMGQELALNALVEERHETKPPARYTDATLIKKLEEQGIGRPSTYASIISTILDRGYARMSGKQLVPTWTAYLAIGVLDANFEEFTDLDFTARMDSALDEIANGKADSRTYLREFFLGEDARPGLKKVVDERKRNIPYPAFELGVDPESELTIFVRNGKDGSPFLQVGEGEMRRYGSIPPELAPADLTVEKAVELMNHRKPEAESVGVDTVTGRRLLVKNRQGFYLEAERTPEEIEAKVKARFVSLPPSVDPRSMTDEEIAFCCSLPKEIGAHPDSGDAIFLKLGKYGEYVECGAERRTVADWRAGMTMTLKDALALLSQSKIAAARGQKAGPIQEFAAVEGAHGLVRILAGRFGPYATDGETNATLPRGADPATITLEEALRLIEAKRAAGPSTKPKFVRRKGRKSAKPRK